MDHNTVVLEPADLHRVGRMRLEAANGVARLRRERAGVGLNELARALGVWSANLSRWERGVAIPRPKQALAWSDALDAIETRQAVP